jgi:hypothetical protein
MLVDGRVPLAVPDGAAKCRQQLELHLMLAVEAAIAGKQAFLESAVLHGAPIRPRFAADACGLVA